MHMANHDLPYQARAAKMTREYVAAFDQLTPAQRQSMKRRGVAGPVVQDYETDQGECDVSDFVEIASALPPISDHARLADALAERFGLAPAMVAQLIPWVEIEIDREADFRRTVLLGRIAGGLIGHENAKISIVGLAFACGLDALRNRGWTSMRVAAKAIGCSPAYISHFANAWCDLLELPRPSGMKSAPARASYQKARQANHWRQQKTPKNFSQPKLKKP